MVCVTSQILFLNRPSQMSPDEIIAVRIIRSIDKKNNRKVRYFSFIALKFEVIMT